MLLVAGVIAVSVLAWFLGKWGGAQLVNRQAEADRRSIPASEERFEPSEITDTGTSEEERASRISEVKRMPKPELPPFDDETATQEEPAGEDDNLLNPDISGETTDIDTDDEVEEENLLAGEDEVTRNTSPDTLEAEGGAEPPAAPAGESGGPLYRLQVGMFTRRENALSVKNDLEANYQIPVFIAEVDLDGETRYRVQAGAFRNRENAEKMARELRIRGHHTYIWKEE